MIKRKIILVSKPFQYRYASVAIATILVAIGLIWLNKWTFLRGNQELLAINGSLTDYAKLLTIAFCLFAVFVVIFSIFVSHKVAGPMYRFEKTLEAITKGDLTARAVTRTGDELDGVKEALNKAFISIHSRVRQDKEKASKAINTIQDIQAMMAETLTEEGLQGIRQKLQQLEGELHEVGSRFKL